MTDDTDDAESSGHDLQASEAEDLDDPADQFSRLLGDLYGTADEFSRLLVVSFPPVQPDDSVWDGIEARISSGSATLNRQDAVHSTSPSSRSNATGRSLGRRLAPLLAVAAILLFLVGAVFVVDNVSQDPTIVASDGVVRQLADPSTGDLALTIATAGDGSSTASSSNLPALNSNETYQLWSVVGDEVVSVGLLGSDPAGVDLRIEGDPTVLALTVEVAGGVAVSEATPVAVWQSS